MKELFSQRHADIAGFFRSDKKKAGFTLPELLVSIAVMSLSGLLICGALGLMIRCYGTLNRKKDAFYLVNAYHDAIRKDLEYSTSFEGAGDDEFFSSVYMTQGKYAEIGGVIYYIEKETGVMHRVLSEKQSAIDPQISIGFMCKRMNDGKYKGRIGAYHKDEIALYEMEFEALPVYTIIFGGKHS